MAARGLGRGVLLLVALAAALGIGEAIVRGLRLGPEMKPITLTGDDTVYRRSGNPILGFELKPGYRDADADLVSSYPSTNSYGQRDVEWQLDRHAGVRRTIVLGDSVVEGHGIRDLAQTIPGQLRSLYPPDTMEVLNFGVSGYCTLAEVELLRVKGLTFAPDIVVLVFVDNDFENFNKQVFQLGAAERRPAVVDLLLLRSRLFRLLCWRFDLFRFGQQVDPIGANRAAIGDDNVVRGLALLRSLADQHGFKVLVAVWPAFDDHRVTDPQVLAGSDGELVVERIAHADGLPTVRLSTGFRAELARRGGVNPRLAFTIGDGVHPSPAGCRIAAEQLKTAVEDLPELTPPPVSEDDLAAGVAAARRLGDVTPDYAGVHVNLGVGLAASGRLEEAVAELETALEIDPGSDVAHTNLASALYRLGRLDEAEQHCRLALALNPGRPEAHYNMGVILAARGHHELAREHFRRALELNPHLAAARRALAAVSTPPATGN